MTNKLPPTLLVTAALVAGGCESPDSDPTMTPDQIKRITSIGIGDARTPPTAQDVPLVLRALTDPDSGAQNMACLAVEKMAHQNFFDAPSAEAALQALLPKLRSPDGDVSEWSARAVGALAADTPFVTGTQLTTAFAETLRMVGDGAPEIRRRGLNLAGNLLPLLGAEQRELTLRAAAGACRRPIAGEADGRAYDIGVRTLGAASRLTAGEGPAAEAARELLRAVEGKVPHGYQTVLVDLAGLAARVDEPLRGRIVRATITAAAEPRFVYSRTSGERSPTRHAGADALAVVAPLLTRPQLDEAERAIPAPGGQWPAASRESAYGGALKALKERREALDRP